MFFGKTYEIFSGWFFCLFVFQGWGSKMHQIAPTFITLPTKAFSIILFLTENNLLKDGKLFEKGTHLDLRRLLLDGSQNYL